MFTKEGVSLSKEYQTLFASGQVVPNTARYNKLNQLTVLVARKKKQVSVYRTTSTHQLNPKFTKAYREGRVITPLADNVLSFPKTSKPLNNKKNKKVVKNFDRVFDRMKSNKKMLKRFFKTRKLTKYNDRFHTCSFKFKLYKREESLFDSDDEGVANDPENQELLERWESFNCALTVPVIRAFINFCSTTEDHVIIYDFVDNQGIVSYTSIIKFLEFLEKDDDEIMKQHTPDNSMRQSLRDFILQLDTHLNASSYELVEIHCRSSEQLVNEYTTPVSPSDTVVANIEAKYITSDYFVSELAKVENEQVIRPTEEGFKEQFRTFTDGVEYRPNSCLATCAMSHMYHRSGKNVGRVKWHNHRSLKKFPPPTYDTISEVCGIDFRDDFSKALGIEGSLQLSLKQFEPFLEMYEMPCYVITPKGDLVYRFDSKSENKTHRLGVCGLTLIISHGHVNLIPDNLFKKFADTFKESQPIECDVRKQLLYEIYQPNEVETTQTERRFNRFPLRRNFEPSRGFAVDTKLTNIERDAKDMVRTVEHEAEKAMLEMPVAQANAAIVKFQKTICITYHYVGCGVSIIECLKNNHNYIASSIQLSGSSNEVLKSFDISYSTPSVKVSLRVGNMLREGLAGSDCDVVGDLVQTVNHMTEYNNEFKRFYQRLYNKQTITTYSDSLLENLLEYTCPPLAFSLFESDDNDAEDEDDLTVYLDTEEGGDELEDDANKFISAPVVIGALDANKAYASNMLAMGCAVKFSPFSSFVAKRLQITRANVATLNDYSLYRVIGSFKGDFKKYLVFDKKTIIYYGLFLKEIVRVLPDITFGISGVCDSFMVTEMDWSEDLKRLYANENLSKDQKKAIPNVLLGCCDKYKDFRMTGEAFHSKTDADAMYNIDGNSGCSRVRLYKKKPDTASWKSSDEEVVQSYETAFEEGLAEEIERQVVDRYDTWNKTNNLYQQKTFKLHVNVNRKRSSTYSQGFLPISVMKYNCQRVSLLKMWNRIERSGTLLPVGVKTDSIFVCENTANNREFLNEKMELLGFAKSG